MTLKVVIFAFKDSGKFEKNYSVHNKTIPYFYTLKAQCTQLYLLRSACLNIILNVDNPIFQRCKSTNIGPRERFGLGSCGRSVGDLRQHVWSTDDARWAVSYQEWLRVRLTCGFWLVTHILRIPVVTSINIRHFLKYLKVHDCIDVSKFRSGSGRYCNPMDVRHGRGASRWPG